MSNVGLPKIRINLATFSVKTNNDVVKTKLEEVLGGIFFFSCSVKHLWIWFLLVW